MTMAAPTGQGLEPPVGAVRAKMTLLDNEIAEAGCLAGRLSERLAPVLGDAPPTVEAEPNKEAVSCPFAGAVASATHVLRSTNVRLAGLIERLDL
jgi:hypothetical protein